MNKFRPGIRGFIFIFFFCFCFFLSLFAIVARFLRRRGNVEFVEYE